MSLPTRTIEYTRSFIVFTFRASGDISSIILVLVNFIAVEGTQKEDWHDPYYVKCGAFYIPKNVNETLTTSEKNNSAVLFCQCARDEK